MTKKQFIIAQLKLDLSEDLRLKWMKDLKKIEELEKNKHKHFFVLTNLKTINMDYYLVQFSEFECQRCGKYKVKSRVI